MGGNLGTRIRSWPGGTHLKSQLLRRQRQEDGEFKASPAKLGRPCLKNKTNERTGVMTQVVEHLSSMLEALSSIPSTAEKRGGRERETEREREYSFPSTWTPSKEIVTVHCA
jgi:hypothetical protein